MSLCCHLQPWWTWANIILDYCYFTNEFPLQTLVQFDRSEDDKACLRFFEGNWKIKLA